MERLEAEKRLLQEKLEQPVSAPMSPRMLTSMSMVSNPPGSMSAVSSIMVSPYGLPPSSEQAATLTEHIINLRREVSRLKTNLEKAERDHRENMAKIYKEEKSIREENVRLQRRLQMEVERREALCRHLSESESSLEMDDERHFNESSRVRTVSSPIPGYLVPSNSSSHSNSSNNPNPPPSNPNSHFVAPAASTVVAPALSSTGQNAASSSERCPTCNQLKALSIGSSSNSAAIATSPPFGNSKTPSAPFNPLTASSSLSSSSSSINSSKPIQTTLSNELFKK